VPQAGTFGNVARNSLNGPALTEWDTSLWKTAKISERLSFQLRGDAFNVLNHTNLNTPNLVVYSSATAPPSISVPGVHGMRYMSFWAVPSQGCHIPRGVLLPDQLFRQKLSFPKTKITKADETLGKPNTKDIGLELTGVELTENGYVKVNERLETTAPAVWGSGEVAGSPQFTQISEDDFRVVRDNIFGGNRVTTGRQVPFCLFTDTEFARVGTTEKEAKDSRRVQ
jgi:hypothetical protein